MPQGYQFKITLQNIEPPIWRRIIVPQDIHMADFGCYILDAMQWKWFYLHRFHIDKALLMPDFLWRYYDYRILHYNFIRDFLESELELEYWVDFDRAEVDLLGWMHTIEYEGEAEFAGKPVCIDGARACPPVDIGFEEGYKRLLETIAQGDKDAVYDMLYEGFGEWDEDKVYDPEAFDKTKCNFRPAATLESLWPNAPLDDIR